MPGPYGFLHEMKEAVQQEDFTDEANAEKSYGNHDRDALCQLRRLDYCSAAKEGMIKA